MLSELLLFTLASASTVMAQAGCMQLSGSSMCLAFASQYINPSNLQSRWDFFSGVTDVASFDAAFSNYLSSSASDGFRAEKYVQQLGCSNVTSTYVLQYSQTTLCSMFTQIAFTAGCYQRTNVVRRMACQSTCLQFATSENYLVDDDLSCGPANLVGDYRLGNLTADFTSCTEWTTLATNNTETCILGQTNEPNCGFRDSRTQLCNYCNPDGGVQVDSCCGSLNANLAGCGYNLAASNIASTPVGTQAVLPLATSTAMAPVASNNDSGSSGLSGGAIAGIVIGAVVFVKLLLLLWVCCFRRKKNGHTIAEEYGLCAGRKSSSDGSASHSIYQEKSSPTSSQSPGMLKEKSGSDNMDGVIVRSSPAHNRLRGRLSLDSSAYTGSSAEARNLVSSYRDHYSTINIVPGSHVIAIYAYNPNLPDELRLEPENTVLIHKIFDDGWASGTVVGSSAPEGFFPLVVCTAQGASDAAYDAASSANNSSPHPAGSQADTLSRSGSFNSAASKLIPKSAPSEAASDNQDVADPMLRKNSTAPKRKPVQKLEV